MKELFQKLCNLFNFGKERRLVNENRGTVETGGDQLPAPTGAPKGKIDVKRKVEEMFDDVDKDMGVLTEGLSPELQRALDEVKPKAPEEPKAPETDVMALVRTPGKKAKSETVGSEELEFSRAEAAKKYQRKVKQTKPIKEKYVDSLADARIERAKREEIAMQYNQARRDLEKGEKPVLNPFKDAVGTLVSLTDNAQGLLSSADERGKAVKQLVKLAQIPKLKDLVIECNYANRYGMAAEKREAAKNLMAALQPYTRNESADYLAALTATGPAVAGGRSVEK